MAVAMAGEESALPNPHLVPLPPACISPGHKAGYPIMTASDKIPVNDGPDLAGEV